MFVCILHGSVQQQLAAVDGQTLFSMSKAKLEMMFGVDEGSRLYSNILVQRNVSGVCIYFYKVPSLVPLVLHFVPIKTNQFVLATLLLLKNKYIFVLSQQNILYIFLDKFVTKLLF